MILRVAPAVIYLSIVASDEYTYRLCTKWHGIDVRSHRPGTGAKILQILPAAGNLEVCAESSVS